MMNILLAAFEAAPFIKTGGLGDVAGSLPAAIKDKKHDVRVILPLLSAIPQEYRDKMEFVCSYEVPLGWRNVYCGLFSLEHKGVTHYFLDNEYYFKRGQVYGEFDDGERVAFFSKAVLETVKYIEDFKPDIIHCNDWHTALIPVFLHELYVDDISLHETKTVFTIHNLQFQGQYDKNMVGDVLGLAGTPAEAQMNHDDSVNFLQGAVIYSDMVTTVSPTYADNICTKEYGEGLEGLFQSRRYKLMGIVNGIDYSEYNPKTDESLTANYDGRTLSKKKINKVELQKELGLDVDEDKPLFVMVTRMTAQKGMDLVKYLMPEFPSMSMQFAILGTGDKEYEESAKAIADANKGSISASIMFSESLSKKFYAAADCFMMPSVFEPCGLAQMMAMKYGTLPLVRKTGGLKDTVKGLWDYGDEATGFSFNDADVNGLKATISQALTLWYEDKKLWRKLQHNAMRENFSWKTSAKEYKVMYDSITAE